MIGLVHILLLGLHQLLSLGELAGQLVADLVQQVQRLIAVDDALFGAEGGALGLVDHAEQHLSLIHIIFRALDLARPGDTVILCGKGHEITQETGGHRLPMDERQIIAEYINGS